MIKKLLLFGFAAVGFAQTLQLSGHANAKAAQSITVSVSLAAGQNVASGVQFTLNVPSDVVSVTPTAGPSATGAGKQLVCGSLASQKLTCLVFGVNATSIGDGVIASFPATLAASLTAPNETFSLSGVVGSNSAGVPTVLAAGPALAIPVLSKCDLNADGSVNTVDVLALVNWILGISQPPTGVSADVNGDGKADLFDAMVIIVAATGGACAAK